MTDGVEQVEQILLRRILSEICWKVEDITEDAEEVFSVTELLKNWRPEDVIIFALNVIPLSVR